MARGGGLSVVGLTKMGSVISLSLRTRGLSWTEGSPRGITGMMDMGGRMAGASSIVLG